MKRESVAFLSAFAVLFELVTGGVFAPVYDAFSPQQVHLSYAGLFSSVFFQPHPFHSGAAVAVEVDLGS